MKPKVSIRKWDMSAGAFPIGLHSGIISLNGYQVLWNGVVIARSSDKNEARRVAYHLRTKCNK